jgi:hypothetical protein
VLPKIEGCLTDQLFAVVHHSLALEMRFDSVPELCRRFSVTFPSLEEAQGSVS